MGPITLPAMEKSGFPPELAAAVVCASSALGPIIPPSATIPTVYAILCTAFPGACTFSQYWVFMWGISLWFILQRVIALFIRVKQYHIGPIAREHRPRLRDALRSGWKAVFLPVVVLFPFLFDNLASGTLITARLGAEGAAAFTSALLATVPSLAVLYVLIIAKNQIRLRDFGKIFRDNIPEIAPIVILILAGFILGSVFADTGISDALNQMIQVNGIPFWAVCTVLPLVITVLGMFLEPMSIILLFGSTVITLGASVGINPILMSGVLVVLTHGMGQMTPPFALTFYIPVVMARANLRKSIKEIVFWCALQYLFVVLVLFGVLPVLGLVPFAA